VCKRLCVFTAGKDALPSVNEPMSNSSPSLQCRAGHVRLHKRLPCCIQCPVNVSDAGGQARPGQARLTDIKLLPASQAAAAAAGGMAPCSARLIRSIQFNCFAGWRRRSICQRHGHRDSDGREYEIASCWTRRTVNSTQTTLPRMYAEHQKILKRGRQRHLERSRWKK